MNKQRYAHVMAQHGISKCVRINTKITQNNNKIGLFEIPFMIIACSLSRLGGETIDFFIDQIF